MLYGVRPFVPAVPGKVSALLVTVALFASRLLARRASKIDPMAALRCE
jgi:ABC-type lipoprotein release transport system permease subunit